MFVTGLVLAAGASVRLGEAKQLLAYRGRTLLDATLDVARSCGFDVDTREDYERLLS
jgi:molybdenum cofactor cytidylyltransferase